MAYRTDIDGEWNNSVDINQLTEQQRTLYHAFKAAYKSSQMAKEAFEASMQCLAPEGKSLVFNYRFGRLSIAVANGVKQERKVVAAKAKQSLADWLAARQ